MEETSNYKDDFNRQIQFGSDPGNMISAMLAILMVLLVVTLLGMAIVYDTNEDIKTFLIKNYIWVNCFLVIFWVIPLENGIWLILKVFRTMMKKITT